ncbi:DUF4440 domain-containing protein [Lysinibacillus sp. 54212]|uniref:DUF4440 domain-containing protein n=1 Tax=Lysinibacillus sp. 54212 TaxID=3119829 RepID=UPI002FC84C03
MKKWLLVVAACLVLTACGNKEEQSNKDPEETEKESIGFEVLGESIEEAADIPVAEKANIVAVFNEYIDAFNAEDIDRYATTLSKNAKGFDYEKDLQEAKKQFSQYKINRQADDVTIVKYNEQEAQVFANLNIEMTEETTDTELKSQGRQVTVFVKEEGSWKVSSVYYIGNN